jgi:hypothetical protein
MCERSEGSGVPESSDSRRAARSLAWESVSDELGLARAAMALLNAVRRISGASSD